MAVSLSRLEEVASTAREVAHALVAVLGTAAGSVGVIVTVLDSAGVHVTAAQTSQEIGALGVAAVLVSKAIDSANDALKRRAS